MATIDYEKKYKEALGWMQSLYDGLHGATKEDAEYYFPELKESEDERIVKELLTFFRESIHGGHILTNKEYDSWIAWLEKQGTPAKLSEEEQNRFAKGVLSGCALSFIDYLDAHKYEGKMCVSNGECKDIENAFQNAMWDKLHRYYCKYIEKQGEQQTAWSEEDNYNLQCCIAKIQYDIDNGRIGRNREILTWIKSIKDRVQPKQEWSEEDERNLQGIIDEIEADKIQAPGYGLATYDRFISWLKSLRPQNRWKPSGEQIKVCKEVYADILSAKGFDLGTVNSELNRLEEQLKKLREE